MSNFLSSDRHSVYVFENGMLEGEGRQAGRQAGRARTNRLPAQGWDVIMDEILIGHSPAVTFHIPTALTPSYFLFCNFLSLYNPH